MDFDQAFERLIAHEGLKYVNDSEEKIHLRIRSNPDCCPGVGAFSPHAVDCITVHATVQLACVWLQRRWVHAPRLCDGLVQRALHPTTQGASSGRSGAGEEKGGRLLRVRHTVRIKGWMGSVPEALQARSLRNTEGRGYSGIRLKVRRLRRRVSSSGIRLSPSRGQAWVAKRHVPQHILKRAGTRTIEMHAALRQLPQTGAQR